jgi:hypothetical protein
MKHIFLFLSAILVAGLVYAEVTKIDKPVVCDSTDVIMKQLIKGEYKERPIWIGHSEDDSTNYTVLINEETKTWTIVQFNKDVACILGTGEKFNQLNTKKSYL